MKKIILSAAVIAVCMSSAFAQDVAVESPHSFTANVTVASDYRFRGYSQTAEEPTIQGGFDYAHASGFYIGNWNSNVSSSLFTDGSIEMDLYAGYAWDLTPDVGADVGVLHYYYPGTTGTDFDTTELYLKGTYKGFYAKYSHSLTDLFGVADSEGSGYLDLGAEFEIADKTALKLHVGHQKVRHNGDLDYTDYSVGVTRDFGFATAGLTYVDTDVSGDDIADGTVVFSLAKSF